MGRFATFSRGIVITVLAGALILVALFYLAANYSQVTNEFTCEGYTSANGTSEKDHGRLQITQYRFWVSLWNSTSDGNAMFQSTKFAFYEGDLNISGEGNFTIYMGISPQQLITFNRATNEVSIDYGPMKFKGNCIAAF